MKFFINAFLFLVIAFSYVDDASALSDYKIKDICRKEKRRSKCIKELKLKKFNLIQGKQIEIPILPFKK